MISLEINRTEKPNKKFLLERINQATVFEDFGIPYSSQSFKNPLRKEKSPSCSFYEKSNGELWLIDYTGWFQGNCFDFVCFVERISFIDCLNLIYSKYVMNSEIKPRKLIINKESEESYYTKTSITADFINEKTNSFWSKVISNETLKKFKVKTVKRAWVNNKLIYNSDKNQKCFLYYFGNVEEVHRVKLYFPKSSFRKFITNSREIEGYKQLPDKGKLLVITKSLKDVMFFYEFGISAIAPPSEGFNFSKELIDELKSRFNKVVSLFDFDLAGVKGMKKLRDSFGIDYILLQEKRSHVKVAKDVTDIGNLMESKDLINLKSRQLELTCLINELRKVYENCNTKVLKESTGK
jgi:hypothetical protein